MRFILFVLLLLLAMPAAAVKRSHAARDAFVRANACPSTGRHRLPCPGFVIDHVKALACGGADAAANMQWQTIAEGKAKDRWERKGPECRKPKKGDRE